MHNCTVLQDNSLHSTAGYCTVLYCRVLHYRVVQCSELYCDAQCFTTLYYPALHCTALNTPVCTILAISAPLPITQCSPLLSIHRTKYLFVFSATGIQLYLKHCTTLKCSVLHCTALN